MDHIASTILSNYCVAFECTMEHAYKKLENNKYTDELECLPKLLYIALLYTTEYGDVTSTRSSSVFSNTSRKSSSSSSSSRSSSHTPHYESVFQSICEYSLDIMNKSENIPSNKEFYKLMISYLPKNSKWEHNVSSLIGNDDIFDIPDKIYDYLDDKKDFDYDKFFLDFSRFHVKFLESKKKY